MNGCLVKTKCVVSLRSRSPLYHSRILLNSIFYSVRCESEYLTCTGEKGENRILLDVLNDRDLLWQRPSLKHTVSSALGKLFVETIAHRWNRSSDFWFSKLAAWWQPKVPMCERPIGKRSFHEEQCIKARTQWLFIAIFVLTLLPFVLLEYCRCNGSGNGMSWTKPSI